jgi:uncharacterized membrane protein YecN with MAPEG domain
MISITAVTAGSLALIYSGIGSTISLLRLSGRGRATDKPYDTFQRLVRSHGNFAEHVPLLLILLFFAEMLGAPRALLAGAAVAIVVARLFHAGGFILRLRHPLQAVGAGMTYTLEAGLGVLLLAYAL